MKTLLGIVLFLFCSLISSSATEASTANDSLICLKIDGYIQNAGEGDESPCVVELIGISGKIDTLVLKSGKKKFSFYLIKNSYYAIRVSRKGYITKYICINTQISKQNQNMHVFEFETTLLNDSVIAKLNRDMLDYPVAIVHYNLKTNAFIYNKEYSKFIRKELFKGQNKNIINQINPGVAVN